MTQITPKHKVSETKAQLDFSPESDINNNTQTKEFETKPKTLAMTGISLSRIAKQESSFQSITKLWQQSLTWCVIFPFLACCCYFGFIASDRYVAETKVIIKQADSSTSNNFDIPLLGTGGSSDTKDTQLVREFILSRDMLHHLDTVINLREHYQNKEADILSRLWETDSEETFLKFYREHLTVEYNDISAVLSIRAQAFSPEFSQKMVLAVLKHSEEYINQISHRLAREQVSFVQSELDRVTEHLRKSKQHILQFQTQYQLFSPEQESGAKLQIVNELEAEITRQRAALNNLRSYMNDTAADVMALKAKIGALENQLAVERKKLVGNGNNNFSDVNAQYAELLLDLEFATDLYKASLMSMEQARIEAYRKLKHLVVVDSPSLAEDAEFPRRLYNLVSILVVLTLLHGVLKIILATIKEHRDV
jgi:capsular polysaccharide transport system permease protein